jgi:hypothetical protein
MESGAASTASAAGYELGCVLVEDLLLIVCPAKMQPIVFILVSFITGRPGSGGNLLRTIDDTWPESYRAFRTLMIAHVQANVKEWLLR